MRHTLAALRVLVVLPSPPLPEGGAAARCAIGLLRGLSARGVDARALAAGIGSSALDTLPAGLDVEVVPIEVPSVWQARRDRLLRPNRLFAQGAFALRVGALAAEADIVHFVEPQTAAAIGLADCPSVTQIHFLTRRDRERLPPWRRDGRIAIELLRAERRACRQARWLLANSAEVARPLTDAAPHAYVAVAPLALDPLYYEPKATLHAPVVGLIGMARWAPTGHAVERLLTRVWPLVRERRPDARLVLAGENMERSTFAHLPDNAGVEWRGRVSSASDFLRELGVLLYPLSSGSGTKVKVLEALALGVPVVTTPDGAEGLGALGGVTVETVDGALARATVSLLEDAGARREAGEAALGTFTAHHSPLLAAGPVIELYERMTA
jgi:polysaccharide biosynthesis protein PslH